MSQLNLNSNELKFEAPENAKTAACKVQFDLW